MGERSFRVCDAKVKEKMCNERNTQVCPICQLDFCSAHYVRAAIGINVSGSGVAEIAKIDIGLTCYRCLKALNETGALFAGITTEAVIRHARAHLSAEALK